MKLQLIILFCKNHCPVIQNSHGVQPVKFASSRQKSAETAEASF